MLRGGVAVPEEELRRLDMVRETIRELRNLGIRGTLYSVVITRVGPWTLSYIKYDDGTIGCGCANNEAEREEIPDDVSFIKDLLNLNTYEVVDRLESFGDSVFINSLRTSIASALSYKLMSDVGLLKKEGYDAETFIAPNLPLFDPSKFVQPSDIVAMVGFHMTVTPLCADIAKEVLVTELMDLKELSVIELGVREKSNVKIFPADKSKEILSRADVVYITGETVVNGTIDEILEFSKNARTRIIYGPTSAFYPKVLFERGVDVSLPMIFPNTPDFRRRFVLSRGNWYFMRDVKQLLIRRSRT